MALETRPFPVLTGKAARDFLKKVENFTITETPEQIREVNQKVQQMIETAKQHGRL